MPLAGYVRLSVPEGVRMFVIIDVIDCYPPHELDSSGVRAQRSARDT